MLRDRGRFTPLSEIAGVEQFSRIDPKITVVFDLAALPEDFPADKIEVNLPYIHALMERGQVGSARFGGTSASEEPRVGVLDSVHHEMVAADNLPPFFAGRWLHVHHPFGNNLQGEETLDQIAAILDQEARRSLRRAGARHLIKGSNMFEETMKFVGIVGIGAFGGLMAATVGQQDVIESALLGTTAYLYGAVLTNSLEKSQLRREFHTKGYRDTIFAGPHLLRAGELYTRSKMGTAVRVRPGSQSK